MDNLSPSVVNQLRRLMVGSAMDKDRAEDRLKDCDPCNLPEDILEPWTSGSSYDRFRAGRVKEFWSAR